MPTLNFSITSVGDWCKAWRKSIKGDKLVVNAIYIFGNAIVTSFAGFLFWTFASRIYSISHVGIASSIVSIVQLLRFIGFLGLGIGMIRFLAEDESPRELFTSIILLSTSAVFILGGCYLLLMPVISRELSVEVAGFYQHVGFMGFLILVTVFTGLGSLFVAAREAKYSFLQSIVMNIIRIVTVYFLIDLEVWGIIGSLSIGYLIAVILSGIFYIPRVLPAYKIRVRINWGKIRNIFSFSIGNYLSSVFRQMPASLFSPMALEILGKSSSAYVYVIFMVVSFVSGPGLALGNSALVESTHSPEDYKKIITRASYIALAVTTALAGIMYLIANPVLGLFGEGYLENAGGLYKMMLIASPFVAANMIIINFLRTKKYIKELVVSSMILAILAVGIPFSLMETMGIIAIGYGWVSAQIFVIIYILFTIRFKDEDN